MENMGLYVLELKHWQNSMGRFFLRAAHPGSASLAAALFRVRASVWHYLCSRPSIGDIDLKVLNQGHPQGHQLLGHHERRLLLRAEHHGSVSLAAALF